MLFAQTINFLAGIMNEPMVASVSEQTSLTLPGGSQGQPLQILENYPRSPLRYPGGKNRAVRTIFSIIPNDEKLICSPFFGGGSLELACTTTMKVYGYDIFEPLVDFWKKLLEEPNKLADRVESYYPLSRTEFYSLQKRFTKLNNKLERAAAFFVLNRCSFSGTTLSGGMSPEHPRFTESSIQRLRDFKVDNLEVKCSDFRESIPRHEDAFLYLDPPYLNDQKLYGLNGSTHKGFDHEALAELILKRERWIMSYNDTEEIRKLYAKHTIKSIDWVYGMAKDKTSNEILILSRDLT